MDLSLFLVADFLLINSLSSAFWVSIVPEKHLINFECPNFRPIHEHDIISYVSHPGPHRKILAWPHIEDVLTSGVTFLFKHI